MSSEEIAASLLLVHDQSFGVVRDRAVEDWRRPPERYAEAAPIDGVKSDDPRDTRLPHRMEESDETAILTEERFFVLNVDDFGPSGDDRRRRWAVPVGAALPNPFDTRVELGRDRGVALGDDLDLRTGRAALDGMS